MNLIRSSATSILLCFLVWTTSGLAVPGSQDGILSNRRLYGNASTCKGFRTEADCQCVPHCIWAAAASLPEGKKGCCVGSLPHRRSLSGKGNKRIYPYFIIAVSGLALLGILIGTIVYYCRSVQQRNDALPHLDSALEEDEDLVEEEAATSKDEMDIDIVLQDD